MRGWLLLAFLAACGNDLAPGQTGLELVVHYDGEVDGVSVVELAVSGEAARKFGPYLVPASSLPPGGTVSLRLEASDAGKASVCAQARSAGGRVLQTGCGTYDVRAGEIGQGTLDLAGTTP